ncbi:MAG TPA: NAD(P)-binding domain-containing protein [Plantibacter sp.]|nr:NAD(P)-binding domain-containing protein [Plantibacter sp.]
MSEPEAVDVVVIGAGQAGLSAAYHLHRRGFIPLGAAGAEDVGEHGDAGTFVVLDANGAPGGAWQHRWRSLTMATVNGIYDLPGMPKPELDPTSPSVDVIPPYFAAFEERFALAVRRPVHVRTVRREDDDPHGRLLVETAASADHPPTTFAALAVVNATGTWTKHFWPAYPGRERFAGRQLHAAEYVSAEEFRGQRVVVVGAGISAIQLLDEISHVAETVWMTRREPEWVEDDFDTAARVEAIRGVEERVRQGLPPGSVISVTGMHWTPWARAAEARGVLVRHAMFRSIEEHGVILEDGSFLPVDAILWATGFRAALDHLAPLGIRLPGGGIRIDGTRAADEPRLHLIGYGPSASTVGANRAGRAAVAAILAERPRGAPGLAPAPPRYDDSSVSSA